MKKHLNTLLFIWLCSASFVFAQGKAEQFPAFIQIPSSEAPSEKSTLFQKYYQMEASDELRPLKKESDPLGFTHEKFQQFYKGVKVEATTSTLHSRDGKATMLTGNYQRISGLDVSPSISAKQAFIAAKAHVHATKYQWELPLSEHNDYQLPTGELVVLPDFEGKKPPTLAYKFDIYAMEPLYRADVYIDAKTGQFVYENLHIHHANVPATGNSIYDGAVSFTAENVGPFRLRQTSMGNGVQTFNLNNGTNYGAATDFTSATSNFIADNVGVEAHWASERTYDYYSANYGRNSYDDAGAVLKSYVHYSNGYFNAFWDGSRMTYGDGCCGATPLVTLDICGHEVTHAVTEFSAGLIYAGQSGALNESFSDIFGEAVENWGKGSNNWLLGDEIGVLIRDMSDPNVTGCPDTYLGSYWDPGQEVHTNSGVQNKWFFLLSDGESGTNDNGNQYCVTGIGLQAAGAIAYRNLTVYLNASSNYAAARTGAINAARDLYGIGSPEEVSTTNAWYAVGVGGPYTPSITCPANIVVNTAANQCATTVFWSSPVGQANCPTTVQTAGPQSGYSYPKGTTLHAFKVTDVLGNANTCSFTVTVNDNQKPTITCPTNQVVGVNGACQGTLPGYSGTVTDNCPGPYGQTQSPAAGTNISGNTTVTLTATDVSLNTGTCQFQVTVNDLTPPSITCPAQQTINANASCQGIVPNYTGLASVSDNCSLPANAVTQTPVLNSALPLGNNNITLTATDGAGNTATCVFVARVIDVTLPNITCPANISTSNALNQCGANVAYSTLVATDNCSILSNTLFSGGASGSFFPVGTSSVTWRAVDGSNNTRTCSFSVTVKDTQLPTITCPANLIKNNDPGLCGAVVTYNPPTAADNCGILSNVQISGLASGAFHPVGATINVWRATDLSNNSASCSFTVTVKDIEAPSINCPADIIKGADFGDCSADLGIYIGTTTFQDNCGISSVTNNNPGIFPIGTTIVTWVAKDGSNNMGTCAQSITIEDREWPEIKCPANIQVKTDDGDCAASLQYAATATDNCPGVSLEYSAAPPAIFEIGLTYVEVTATDAQGHTTSCVFQVSVGARTEICNDIDDDCDGWVDEAQDWSALAKRLDSNGLAGEEYGVSVAIDGDYAIVGAKKNNTNTGAAYILFRDKNGTNEWGQIAALTDPGLMPGDNFGASVAISGGVAVVGAPQDDEPSNDEGSVLVFYQNTSNPEQWDFAKKVTSETPGAEDHFGASVALEGDRLLVGANLDDESGANSGAAYVFYRNLAGANNWGQAAKLLATTGAADDNLGISVDMDGDFAIVGANGVDGLNQNAGAAYIFNRNQFGADAWGQVARIRAKQSGQDDNFGSTVGISGPWAIVGADGNDQKGANAGAAFIFYKNQNGIINSWGQSQVIHDYNGQAGNLFGSAVGIDEPYAVVATKGDDPFGAGSGGGFVYLLDGNTFVEVAQLTDGGGNADDALGSSAAISGRNIILGAPLDNHGANSDQGAVIVYGGLCDDPFGQEDDSRNAGPTSSETSVRCFPVPFQDVLNIEVNGILTSDAQLTIVNAMGQIVSELYNGSIEGDRLFQWQPVHVADGLYFLRITTGEKVITKSIIRTR